MKGVVLLFVLVSLSYVCAEEDSSFVSLDRVKEMRESGDVFLLAFATSQCPHCIRLGNQIPEITRALELKGIQAELFKMDLHVDENKKFSDAFEINGVPTIYLFIGNDEPVKYQGTREPEDISSFVDAVVNLAVTPIDSEENYQELSKEPALILVDSNTSRELTKIARSHLNLKAFSISSELAKTLGLGIFTVVRNDGVSSLPSELSDGKTSAELNSWIKMASLPPVVNFPAGAQDIFGAGIDSILFFVYSGSEAPEWLKIFAEKFRGSVIFAYVNRDDESTNHVLDFFGIKENSAVRIFNASLKKQFWFAESVSQDTLQVWLDAYLKGEVAAHLKTEELLKDWDQESVKVLVGSNLAEVVLDSNKMVFVMYYAPWCGHCKSLHPDWEKLAANVADLEDVVIAKVDATANDVEDGFGEIAGFPTLRLYHKDNSMVEYNGKRSLDDLEKYIRENSILDAPHSDAPIHVEF